MIRTRSARVSMDLSEMLAALARFDGTKSHTLIDPLIRDKVEELFNRLPEADRQYALERIRRQQQGQIIEA